MADIIIVVDDEKEIADLIALYLENDGFEVHKFLTGADALKFVEKCEPALAVLDVMLPDTDGFALTIFLPSCSLHAQPIPTRYSG